MFKMTYKGQRGFTLVELMIVVVILTVLAGVGYPLYQDQVRKARRTDGRGPVMKLALLQEQYLTGNANNENGYFDENDIGLLDPNDRIATAYDRIIDELDRNGDGNPDYYNVTIDDDPDGNAATPDFQITVTAIGGQLKDTKCQSFSIDQRGIKAAKDSGGNSTNKCW